ncbi:MAG: hypothetical protein IKV48_01450 [Eggerthellaceae bacterium]|nr:hypothetical protein [Eggerthellaceae bacterium]
MRSATRRVRNALIAYAIVWLLSVVAFWTITSGSDAMGYSLVFIWLLNPAAIVVASLCASMKEWPGFAALLLAAGCGLLYMLLSYLTFTLGNIFYTGNISAPDPMLFVVGALASVIGMLIGRVLAKRREARK